MKIKTIIPAGFTVCIILLAVLNSPKGYTKQKQSAKADTLALHKNAGLIKK